MANELSKISGGSGCDIVRPEDGAFTARIDKIYAISVREDSTTIEWIKECRKGVDVTVSDRSWIGGESSDLFHTLNKAELFIPDYPVSSLEVGAGSVIVYYSRAGWKHLGTERD